MLRSLLIFISLFYPQFLLAEVATVNPVAEDPNMETMVVKASRTPVSAAQLGSSVTIITKSDLEKRQLTSLAEVLRDVPGFAVSRAGVFGSATQIRVRGAEANQVLVFIDGIEANDLAQGSEFNFAYLMSSDVERIEVIRGPQSALWGSDALAGVINIITTRGRGEVAMSGFAESGSHNSQRGGGGISGSGSHYDFSLNGSYFTTAGENISRIGDENDGYENGTVSLSFGYRPINQLAFEVVGRHTDATNEFDSIDFFNTGLPVDAENLTEAKRDYLRGEVKVSLFDNRWEHIFSTAFISTDNENFAGNLETDSNGGKRYKYNYQTNFFLETPGFADAAHVLTFAVEREKEEFTQRGPVSFFGDPNQDLELTTTSLIFEYRVALWEQLDLSAGFRQDNNSDFKDANTYRFTTSYHIPATATQLHASYGTGIKNPTFTERFGFFSLSLTPFVGNAQLKPERSRGWEIGVRQGLFDERLQFDVTYFNERLQDEINGFVFDPLLFVFTAANLTGQSRRQGVEISGQLSLFEDLTLKSSYTYLDAREPDPLTGEQIKEVRRPEHLFSANLDWNFFDNRADLNLNLTHTGRQTDNFFPPWPNPAERVTLSSFTLVNLTGSYQLNRYLRLFGRVENLLDEEYEQVYGYRSPGLAVFAGLKLSLQP